MSSIFATMELIERDNFLSALHSGFKDAASGEGHCFFIFGEAGIGKTSLVKTFLKDIEDESVQYLGSCDSLFTPRPLAPLYDLALQINETWVDEIPFVSSKAELFTRFVHELTDKQNPVVIVFEDIHWADEATLDFVKFFARRISRTKCLFILTLRDEEINQQHPLKNVFADLPPDTFTRLQLEPFSREAVQLLADEKGFDGEEVFKISGGNPFYVNEILASYSLGVPDSVKDSILSIYNRMEEETKNVCQLLSVMPEGLELNRLYQIDSSYHQAIESCLEYKILVIKNNKIFFKHELYRRTIEESLSPFKRITLNKKLLQLFLTSFEEKGEIEKIVHHAKNANENKLVVHYAPQAARQAAYVGAHIEASKLFLVAIEYSEEDNSDLVNLYESYAYECSLINQINEAIIYQSMALKIWKEKNEVENIGNSFRFLSRLWWFEGNRQKAESFGSEAVEILTQQPSSKAKAMAYSNMAQLNMLSDEAGECIFWGEKAITIAREIKDEETIIHAKTSMGGSLMIREISRQEGFGLLKESLDIALKNCYHEQAGRAYASIISNLITTKDYAFAKKLLEKGINYCDERELDSFRLYLLGWKARLLLETGKWEDAFSIADNLLKKENLLPIVKIGALVVVATIQMRRGEQDALPRLLEAKKLAFKANELQRIIPAITALLEYEWMTGESYIPQEELFETINQFVNVEKNPKKSRFFFWAYKVKERYPQLKERYKTVISHIKPPEEEAAIWEKLGCPYEQALSLFEGNEESKLKSLAIMQQLGASALAEKMKLEMRSSGIKKIPRGLRESTKTNPAQLTNRELDVLGLLKTGIQNKEIADTLFISRKTVDHHISSILFKLDVNSRSKAVSEALRIGILK